MELISERFIVTNNPIKTLLFHISRDIEIIRRTNAKTNVGLDRSAPLRNPFKLSKLLFYFSF